MPERDFDLIAFDPANEGHKAFVYDSFRRSIDCWPWSAMPRQMIMERLKRELASPGTVTRIVAPLRMADDWLGWVAVRQPSTVVFAFTKYAARRFGMATAACERLGIRFEDCPVGVVFWSPACARLAAGGGYRLYLDTRSGYDERRPRG